MNTEVEKKYQPTEEQLELLLKDSVFEGIENNHDIYFDDSNFSFFKNGTKLRKRNGIFELKIRTASSSNIEITGIKEIEDYFKTDDLDRYLNENHIVEVANFKTERHIYSKEGFSIHKDKTDFGYEVCEIELLFKGTGQKEQDDATSKVLKKKIKCFAEQYGWEAKNLVPKWAEYLKKFNPEAYSEIFKDRIDETAKEKNNVLEFKMK